VCRNGLEGLEIAQKTTSDKFAYSIALETSMTGEIPVEADICLLEEDGWKSYDFVSLEDGDDKFYVDLRPHVAWSNGDTGDNIIGIEWTQIKFDRWVRFPVVDFGEYINEPAKYQELVSFYLEAQSCRFRMREVS
jgi:hypothetical protein